MHLGLLQTLLISEWGQVFIQIQFKKYVGGNN